MSRGTPDGDPSDENQASAHPPSENGDNNRTHTQSPSARVEWHSPSRPAPHATLTVPRAEARARYEIIAEHGRGGLGRVSRARDHDLERDVAIKELISRNPLSELRFFREALITARLEHPGIVPVHEAGRWHDGTPFYAMKLVAGRPLRDLIAERHTVDERLALLHHVIAVADAIAYAHDRNIIHRDLKPANVIIGDFGETVVIDWGLAKDLTTPGDDANAAAIDSPQQHPDLTSTGTVLGTPAYMAPEQERGEHVDQRADVFAIGAMLWELCALQKVPPTGRILRHKILRRSNIDPDLVTILDKALDPAPTRRYANAGELASDLKAFKSGARIAARTYSLPSILAHWLRRHRAQAAATAAAIGLAVVGAIFYVHNMLAEQTAIAAEQQVTQLEVDQGRQALVDNSSDAKTHLLNAYRRGEHSDGTKFMLARALQSDRAQLAELPGRADHAWSARFSPTGDVIVTTDDQTAQLWDAKTYQLRFVLPHGDVVYDAIFSRDGATLYTACHDGSVGVWSVASGTRLKSLRARGKSKAYYMLALSPDEQQIAAIDIDGTTADVWDSASSVQLASLPDDGLGHPFVAFAADGRSLVTSGGSEVRLFDTATWQLVGSVPNVRDFSIDPTGPRLATANLDGEVLLQSIPDGKLIRRLGNAGGPIEAVSFSPDGQRIASSAKEQTRVWDTATGHLQMQLVGRRSRVRSLEFDRESNLLLLGANDGSATIIDVVVGISRATYTSTGRSMVAHFSPDAQRVATASREEAARVWSTSSTYFQWGAAALGAACKYILPSHRRFLALACRDSSTKVWDLERGQIIAELPGIVDEHAEWNSLLAAVSAHGDRAAIARGDHVDLYELPSKRLLQTIQLTVDANVVAFGLERSELAIGDLAGGVVVATDHEFAPLPRATAGIDNIEILRDRVIIASADGKLGVYDLRTRRLVATFNGAMRVLQMRASADGSRLVTLSTADLLGQKGNPPFVTLWDLDRGALVGRLDNRARMSSSVDFVNGDREIVTSGLTITRWSAATGRLIQEYRAASSFHYDATMMPGNRTLVAGRDDGGLRFWDVATGQQLWETPALSVPVLAIRIWNQKVVTVGTTGEISGWEFPNPDQVIRAMRTTGLSCKDEVNQACSTAASHP